MIFKRHKLTNTLLKHFVLKSGIKNNTVNRLITVRLTSVYRMSYEMYLFFFSGFFQIVFDISIIFPQSFLDLEYAILEVGAKEEPTKPPREELDITRWKKIKIKKKKRRNKKLKEMIAAELLARNDTVTESKTELPSLPEEVNDEPLIKNDILPTFPDTPPMNLDHVPCSQHIDSLA